MVVCTDRPEAYMAIQGVVDHVEEKWMTEGVRVLRHFVTYKAGDPAENARGRKLR